MNIDSNNKSRAASPSPSVQSAPGRLQTSLKLSAPRPFGARFTERFDLKQATFDSLASRPPVEPPLKAPKLAVESGAQAAQKASSVVQALKEMALFGLKYTALSVGSLLALPFVLTALVLFAAAMVVEKAYVEVRDAFMFGDAEAPAAA